MSRIRHCQSSVPLLRPRACVRRSPSLLRPARVSLTSSPSRLRWIALVSLSVSFPPRLPPSSPSWVSASVFVTAMPDCISPLSFSLFSSSPLPPSRSICVSLLLSSVFRTSRISLSLACPLLRAHSLRLRLCVHVSRLRLRFTRVPNPSLSDLPRHTEPRGRVSPVYVLLSGRLARFRARIARPSTVLVAPARETAAFLSSTPQTWLAPSRPSGPDRPRLCLVETPPLDQHPPSVPTHPSPFLCPTSSPRPSPSLFLSLSFSFPPMPRDASPPRLVRYVRSLSPA